jgi:hypothetical protein
MRRALLVLALLGCETKQMRDLDLDKIDVSPDAKLRTDTVGEGTTESQATFVLVDAENHGTVGAYVTLGGELADASGAKVGELRPQVLWLPPGEQRTFALIDHDAKARPTAAAAKIHVRGAKIPSAPPPVRVDEIRELVDNGRIVVQGTLHNDAKKPGEIMVIGSFHDETHHPMTRPFAMVRVAGEASTAVQFVGPEGSKHGTIYFGEMIY